jgi:hypothetical protein
MSNGRNCDNCETHLNDDDYESYGSWSYTCHDCGFSYRHGSAGVGEQVEKFNSRPNAVDGGDADEFEEVLAQLDPHVSEYIRETRRN